MTEPLFAFELLAAIVAVSIGSGKLVSWRLDRRWESARRSAREADFIVQARAELVATGWATEDEASFLAIRGQQGVSLKHLQEARRA